MNHKVNEGSNVVALEMAKMKTKPHQRKQKLFAVKWCKLCLEMKLRGKKLQHFHYQTVLLREESPKRLVTSRIELRRR